MNLNQVLEFVSISTPEQLSALRREELMYILSNLGPEERSRFLFAKNIKIFGGINNYIEDVFNKNTVETIRQMPAGPAATSAREGLQHVFETMLTYPDVTPENKQRIHTALITIHDSAAAAAAAAAGGRRTTRGGKYESLPKKLCGCIKKVRKTSKNKNEGRAIAICVTSVLHTKGKTLKKFSCRNGPTLETQPWPKK